MFEFSGIQYLVHVTSRKNSESILKSGYIFTNNELLETKIEFQDGFSKNYNVSCKGFHRHYPGVYMAVINIFSGKKFSDYIPSSFDDPVFILFHKEILLHKTDFHINNDDINGYIIPPFVDTGMRTYLNYQLKDFVEMAKYTDSYNGEVVFHSKVSTKHFMKGVYEVTDDIPEFDEREEELHKLAVRMKKDNSYCIKFTPIYPGLLGTKSREFLRKYIYYMVDTGFIPASKIKELVDDDVENGLMCINNILESKFEEYKCLGYL